MNASALKWMMVGVLAEIVAWSPLAMASAPGGRFTVAADTAKDEVTGLVWQRAVPATTYNWADAKTYCQGLKLGGFTSGWRLPSVKELTSIVDSRTYFPAIDRTVFPATPSAYFWTSSVLADNTNGAWIVYFFDGHSNGTNVTETLSVRCVR